MQNPAPTCPVCNKREALLMSPDFSNLPDCECIDGYNEKDEWLHLAWCSCGHIWQWLMNENVRCHWDLTEN